MATNLDSTLGVLYISTLVSATLYGVGCTQIWFYFRKYRIKDPWWVQTLVGLLSVFDTCQQAVLSGTAYTHIEQTLIRLKNCFLAACVYRYLVTFHDTAAIRVVLVKTLIIEIFFSNFIAIFVQQFYCWRIYKLSNNIALAGFLTCVAWASLAAITGSVFEVGRFYTNSFMVTLNSREYIRSMTDPTNRPESYSLPTRTPGVNSIPSQQLAIRIDTMTEHDTDRQYPEDAKGAKAQVA
ncbi:hypothetical protein GLOTRDRAFT_127082 [Gloeophyllum trabeum ATCC 11539]|uniref:Uncharacterized protein n=1 Tax=Gloeophyllum trabeum (strain ATCC 11539 / FP-39264 / Madison 617) TaxID=670483 RepID=S7RV03_GLOTA|nr:uncharacterized protein GLOTRDRAFT_127082 [Gloeophyllum trabeum ATCC 11539]EPQ58585.1 hypothetical protein GLOTRDRAFT_127082 [Gloeophyllum trabeum ATCC 11539]